MEKSKTIALWVIIGVSIILLGGGGFLYYMGHKGIPTYSGKLVLEGLAGEVAVYRDKYAIPHVYAQNEPDLYRAVGYCMAQDRLFQMDFMRRLTSGRLSEIVGEKAAGLDHRMRALRIDDKSQMLYKNAKKEILIMVEAFCDGINQYLDRLGGNLPIEFTILGYSPEPWKPEQVFNVISYFSFDLSTAWDSEIFFHNALKKVGDDRLREIIPQYPRSKEVIFPDFAKTLTELDIRKSLAADFQLIKDMGLTIFDGSNNWAVSAEKSATGKPIFANDMHLGLFAPGIWYQMHHVVEGKVNVTGVMAPGQPFIVAGHNEDIAWGFTNVMVDDMDFYLEKINPQNPNEYEFNGQWRKMEVRKEIIRAKGGKEIEKEIRFTHRGPIISEFKGFADKAISMRWIGNEDSNEVRTLYLVNRAKNWDDFKNAMSTFKSVCQNTIYADTAGNIGLYCSAGVPIREKGDGISIMPGWTDEYDWKGMVPFEKLPHSFNPENGFLASANNKTVGDDYPYYISTWFAPDYRFRRINEMLAEKKTITMDDFKKMHSDFKSKLVDDLKADIVASVKGDGNLSSIENQCLQLLDKWDGVLAKEIAAPAIFEMFYIQFAQNLFGDELGDDLMEDFLAMGYILNHSVDQLWDNKSSTWYDNVSTPDRKESYDDIVRASFRAAVAQLQNRLGGKPAKWQWGDLHQLTLKHPLGSVKILDRLFNLNRGPYPVCGSAHTACPYQYKFTNPFEVVHGASHRHIYVPNDWDASLSVIPTGTSGIPTSGYYCDQTELYVNNEYHPDYFSRELVEKNAVFVMTMVGQ